MEEKILIKSEPCNLKPIFVMSIILSVLLIFCVSGPIVLMSGSLFGPEIGYIILSIIIPNFIAFLIFGWLSSYQLTVTDKRIYGTAFGKRVDLPIDSVSATARISELNGISISTSSGRISFFAIKNVNKIYQIISNLLIERQQEKANATTIATAPKSDEADQLKKFKDLLDSGVITQEEFDAKKKQLLGL